MGPNDTIAPNVMSMGDNGISRLPFQWDNHFSRTFKHACIHFPNTQSPSTSPSPLILRTQVILVSQYVVYVHSKMLTNHSSGFYRKALP